jgi:hypothetical protein
MTRELLDTHQKAVQINLDNSKYGTFAEIGAGQEVARWFFRVGGAAGTIAKTMSAYDMTFSDAIYGPCERYVSRQRLEKMLEHEYGLLIERLAAKRGETTKFFVFADTVAARSYSRKDDTHGWLGMRFQTEPRGEPSQVILHVRLWDKEIVAQQETLGILGVNVVHGAMSLFHEPETFVESLLDNLNVARVEVDMIQFSGPAFTSVDSRLMALKLVESHLTDAAMFNARGEVEQPSDALHKKAILCLRGSFRPVTNTTVDMFRCAQQKFVKELKVRGEEVVTLLEMTLKNLSDGDRINPRDFLERVDVLRMTGKKVLISNLAEYHRLADYFFRYTQKMVGLVMGVPSLKEVFEEKYYHDLAGGILESFGRMFKNDLKLYVYPYRDPQSGVVTAAYDLEVAPHLRHLHAHLVENRLVESLRDYDERCLPIFSRDVLRKIQSGEAGWEKDVPEVVSRVIKERKLFGYKG